LVSPVRCHAHSGNGWLVVPDNVFFVIPDAPDVAVIPRIAIFWFAFGFLAGKAVVNFAVFPWLRVVVAVAGVMFRVCVPGAVAYDF
jgi:hypothetical protein